MGGMMVGTIFGSLVAGFVGSMIAQQFFDSIGDAGYRRRYLAKLLRPRSSGLPTRFQDRA
jgi:hypothetical protein